MSITKSTRHHKIIGNFGEAFPCNWLSRSGFEVTIVDHTGLDIVAYHPATTRRLGITVKSRTRSLGSETTSVTVFSYRKGKDDRKKLLDACTAFGCEPWVALYGRFLRKTGFMNWSFSFLATIGPCLRRYAETKNS